MNDLPGALTILSAMITPAMLIAICGSIIVATSIRLGRVLERTRHVVTEFKEQRAVPVDHSLPADERAVLFDLMRHTAHRSQLLQRAMTYLYLALSAFVATGVAIGLIAVTSKVYAWLPILFGIAGAGLLLWASLLLIMEFRVAMHLVDGEMRLVLRLAEEAPGLLRHRAAGNGFLGRARAMLP